MEDRETVARIGIVTKAMKAFGVVDTDRIKAIVDITSGIPWLVPAIRGEEYSPSLLFAAAVARAALGKTFGAPGPGDIMESAIEIAGKSRSQSGHESIRPWVKLAMDPIVSLGIDHEDSLHIGMSQTVRKIG